MERVMAVTKKYLGLLDTETQTDSHPSGSFRSVLQKWFPFLAPGQEKQVLPDYSKKEEHNFLYLDEKLSAARLVYPETVSLTIVLITLGMLIVGGLAYFFGTNVLVIISGSVAAFYFFFMVFKLVVIITALRHPLIDFTDEEIARIPDEELPVYTIIAPLREEAEVAEQIIQAMKAIDYPEDKLDLIITLEKYDTGTRDALVDAGMPSSWNICWLPDTTQKSKPKCLNVAFRQVRGEFLVIYDAEIIPDANQMKKAYLAFKKHEDISIMQTRLDHYNTDQNILTRLFNTEFSFHYDMFLPGLQKFNFPIPLSGHSVHFRTKALRDAGGWDPYNVAEDCELGMRLFRCGHRSGIINSMSREEAASDVIGWIKQRTRWMKGFIQTAVVHLRYPLELKKDLGSWRDFFVFLVLVPGTVLLNLLNFVTAGILILWFLTGAEFIQDMYPMAILYIANIAAIVGGFIFIYLNLIAMYRRDRFHLVKYFIFMPFYWFILSVATARAAWQLRDAKNAHKWEKTTHGTHLTGS